MPFNLFETTPAIDRHDEKTRTATSSEAIAYLNWCAKRAGVPVPNDAEYHEAGIYCRAARKIIVPMPGFGADPTVTMEMTDAAGQVVRTSRIGVDRKGAIGLKMAAVREACAIVKVRKPRVMKTKPALIAPVVEAQPVAAVAAETPQAGVEHIAALLATVEALAARVAQLEAMPAPAPVSTPVALYGPPAPALAPVKRQRSASEARAILRAWNMRAALRQARRDEETLTGAYREALAAGRRALVARNDAEKRVVVLSNRRGRAAAALIRMRADRRTARREVRGLETGLSQAQGQLARLQPLADALAGLIAPPAAAAPAGDNVVPLRA